MNRIQVFTKDGTFLRLWGTPGSGPGQFNSPYGIALGPDGTVYVADRYNLRVQAFTGIGNFLTQWATIGQPAAIATDAAGRVFVAEGSVRVYSSTGSLLATYDMPPGCYARGVAVSPGRIFVADDGGNRVFEFTSSGAYIRQTGGRGSGPGQFNDPTALCVDGDGHVLVTDSFNHRVQKLGDVVVPTLGVTWGHLKALYR